MFGEKFDYLRLKPEQLDTIQLTQIDIRNVQRRIFCQVELDDYEIEQIAILKERLQQEMIPYSKESFPDELMLRFLYSTKFIIPQTIDILKNYFAWLQSNPFEMNLRSKEYINSGTIYISGRDRQMRPTLIIQAYRIDFERFNLDEFLKALYNLLVIMEDYMLYPGKVENWNVFIEMACKEFKQLPIKTLQLMIINLQNYFPCFLNKIFVLHPSEQLRQQWEVAKVFVDSVVQNKILFLNLFSPDINNYSSDQVEFKFNGIMKDMQSFYPPMSTLKNEDEEYKHDIAIKFQKKVGTLLDMTRIFSADHDFSNPEKLKFSENVDYKLIQSKIKLFPETEQCKNCPVCQATDFSKLLNTDNQNIQQQQTILKMAKKSFRNPVEKPWYLNSSDQRASLLKQSSVGMVEQSIGADKANNQSQKDELKNSLRATEKNSELRLTQRKQDQYETQSCKIM